MGSRYNGNEDELRALSAFINLMRASESLMALQCRRLSEDGLTATQWGTLEALFHRGPMCQKDLGKKLLKSGGNITMVVNNLEKRALVQRKRDERDHRLIEIRLTAKGRRLVERVLPRHVAGIVGDMSRLGAGEMEELRRMCRKLGKSGGDEEE
jgi:MarR family 2-MHQ and catechol resistance regulon transcriptional repressor